MSEKVFKFDQTWVLRRRSLLWFVGLGMMFALMAPAEKKRPPATRAPRSWDHVRRDHAPAAVLLLIVMIFKPGF